jgi:hypothetical protein
MDMNQTEHIISNYLLLVYLTTLLSNLGHIAANKVTLGER